MKRPKNRPIRIKIAHDAGNHAEYWHDRPMRREHFENQKLWFLPHHKCENRNQSRFSCFIFITAVRNAVNRHVLSKRDGKHF